MSLKIAVLMGGRTSEHEISIKTGEAVAAALTRAGHDVGSFCLESTDAQSVLSAVEAAQVTFVALHGGAGEDGRVQAVLELGGHAYVGSRPGPCAVAMDKVWTKQVARSVGVPTTAERVLGPDATEGEVRVAAEVFDRRVVLKPTNEGSAVGVFVCDDADAAVEAWRSRPDPGAIQMIEPFVDGRELTVPVLWDQSHGVIEIRPRQGFYDYTNKYTVGRTEYDCPADLEPELAETVASHALQLYRALHLRDMARIDFRLDLQGQPFLLEANTIPGMTDTSLLPMGAALGGIDFDELCDRLCRVAFERGPLSS